MTADPSSARFRHALVALAAAELATVAVAFGARIAVGDGVRLLRPLVYGMSLPVAALLVLDAAVMLLWARRRRTAALALVAALALGAAWWRSSYASHACEPSPAAGRRFRLVLWNVARGRLGYARVDRVLREEAPDAVVLIEAERRPLEGDRSWRAAHPGFEVESARKGIVVMARGAAPRLRPLPSLGTRTRGAEGRLELAGLPIRLLAVDFDSSPFASKAGGIAALAALVDRGQGQLTIVAGDFNTPLDAAALAPLRLRLEHALAVGGRGFVETWPSLAPLLAIDHVFVDRRLRVTCARKRCLVPSDHCAIVVEMEMRAP